MFQYILVTGKDVDSGPRNVSDPVTVCKPIERDVRGANISTEVEIEPVPAMIDSLMDAATGNPAVDDADVKKRFEVLSRSSRLIRVTHNMTGIMPVHISESELGVTAYHVRPSCEHEMVV